MKKSNFTKPYFLFVLWLAINCFFISCSKKSTQGVTSKSNEDQRIENIDTFIVEPVETMEEAIDPMIKTAPTILIPENYLLAALEKTECYGQCPVFSFHIFADGRVRYHGKKYVQQYGEFVANIDESTILKIKEKANQLGIMKLGDTFPSNKVMLNDLPMTITKFHNGFTPKVMRNNYDAPKVLLEFERFLEKLIGEIQWVRKEGP